jgi:pyruvate/2-oxoacid:ferredoxin oxidoreductase beta subunit
MSTLREWLFPVFCAVISGILAVYVSNTQMINYQDKQTKIETLRKIFGYRYVIFEPSCVSQEADDNFYSGMNEAIIIFSSSNNVLKAINDIHNAIEKNNATEKDFSNLYQEMLKDIGIDHTSELVFSGPLRRGSCVSNHNK